MNHTHISQRRSGFQRTIACCAIVTLLAGCATAPGNRQNTAQGADPCNTTSAAVGMGLLGAVLGAAVAGKEGAVMGAAMGGAIGYATCAAYNVQSVQRKTAQQVETQYRRDHGALPDQPTVVNYSAGISAPSVQRGQKFKVQSAVEVVDGSMQPVRSVREELVVYTPDGNPIGNAPSSKPFEARTGGRYENAFELTLPQGVSQGQYAVKTDLFVNEQKVATRDMSAKVVLIDNVPHIVELVQVASR